MLLPFLLIIHQWCFLLIGENPLFCLIRQMNINHLILYLTRQPSILTQFDENKEMLLKRAEIVGKLFRVSRLPYARCNRKQVAQYLIWWEIFSDVFLVFQSLLNWNMLRLTGMLNMDPNLYTIGKQLCRRLYTKVGFRNCGERFLTNYSVGPFWHFQEKLEDDSSIRISNGVLIWAWCAARQGPSDR